MLIVCNPKGARCVSRRSSQYARAII